MRKQIEKTPAGSEKVLQGMRVSFQKYGKMVAGAMFMKEFLFVGLGGAVGAMLRYGMSMVPVKSEFPYMTLLINFLGAIAIGILAAMSMRQSLLTEHSLLLLKTGVCGGFTTFSTFSLEAVSLLEQHKTGMGITYILSSVLLCLLGVLLGKAMLHPL